MTVYMSKILILAGFMILALSTKAYAYVDPGSGSAIVTAILGGIAAVTYTLRKQFYKIKNLFKKPNLK